MSKKQTFQNLMKSIGPGILFAGAAVGGSHLVQSTRAGANYGFGLLGLVLLANALKYPFFEYGQRYTAATGKSLLEGYLHLGKPVLFLFFALSFVTAIVNCAAVTLVTAALAAKVIGFGLNVAGWSGVLFVLSMLLIFCGGYRWLDRSVKFVIALLAVSTLLAFAMAWFHGFAAAPDFQAESIWTLSGISFLVALLGWMPAPIEASVWSSLWTLEKAKDTNHQPTLKETRFDFNLGYISTAVLAVAFMGLGALVMFGTGETFAESGIAFAGQVIELYKKALGDWSGPIIAVAALTTMISTTLTVVDAYPRTMAGCMGLLFDAHVDKVKRWRYVWTVFVCAAAMLVILYFVHSLKAMIDFATIISFLAAPVFAFINFKVVTDKHFPKKFIPGFKMRLLSVGGLFFLTGISVVFVVWSFVLPVLK